MKGSVGGSPGGMDAKAAYLVAVFAATVTSSAYGQEVQRESEPIRATHVGAAAAGTVALFFVDEPLRELIQANRTKIGDGLASVFRQLGEVGVVYPASLGVLGVGLVASDSELKRSGTQLTVSLTLAAGVTVAGKFVFGRARPTAEKGAWSYDPFTEVFQKALPSGHTALAFAFATTLADFTESTLSRTFLYATAAGTGWSRLNDDRHWLSDVGLGAIIGVTSSKLVTGRWTLFGIETPDYLADPGARPTEFGEIVVSAAAGIAVFHLARLAVQSGESTAPFIVPVGSSEWAAGVRMTF